MTPFRNKILGWGWIKWLKKHNPHLLLKVAQGLEVGPTKGFYPTNMQTFYANLTKRYNLHKYQPWHIQNHNKFDTHNWVKLGGGRGGDLGLITTYTCFTSMYLVTPNEWKWLSMLLFINATWKSLLNFYIFKGKKFIERCEFRATMELCS